jgi:hypothetical protein
MQPFADDGRSRAVAASSDEGARGFRPSFPPGSSPRKPSARRNRSGSLYFRRHSARRRKRSASKGEEPGLAKPAWDRRSLGRDRRNGLGSACQAVGGSNRVSRGILFHTAARMVAANRLGTPSHRPCPLPTRGAIELRRREFYAAPGRFL